ncbi:hypothetical protein WSK_2374 [Novosphingobium sp. Rr 2-17]|uniref:hypothetical protein n=1 Tax=Novosphingobium sp. Rr 2-17 TaxID=555793 RepID=UPI000269A505|nr:hypothetical protein [Novosphingobium sp. Rr 2-17]EIZ79186.1 hypothetical protein WSK_2374 [Novosphingobium sp. Rr 2-17]
MLYRPAFALILAAVPLALAACAHNRVEAGFVGQRPAPASFGFAPESLSGGKFADRFKSGLVDRGFTLSDQPTYRLDLTLAEIPGKTGLYAPSAGKADSQVWRLSPSRSRSAKTYRTTLSLTDAATGRELVRVYANERGTQAQWDEGARLADALLSQLAGTPPEHNISSKPGG